MVNVEYKNGAIKESFWKSVIQLNKEILNDRSLRPV